MVTRHGHPEKAILAACPLTLLISYEQKKDCRATEGRDSQGFSWQTRRDRLSFPTDAQLPTGMPSDMREDHLHPRFQELLQWTLSTEALENVINLQAHFLRWSTRSLAPR
jgi:hypothetical protein